MEYSIKRGEERFGPYTLAEVQRYVQSGNIASTDLAQSEGMTDWVPVSQILGNIPAPVTLDGGSIAAEDTRERVPLPPNLHWGFVVLLGLFFRQFFNMIWAVVQANWARRLINDNKPLVLVAMYPAGMVAGIMTMALQKDAAVLGAVFIFAGLIAYLFGVFSIKAAMEQYYNSVEKINLVLSPAMTFFFGTTYLQYHVNQLHKLRKAGLLSS